jgi:hypothetical protein
MNYQLRFDGGRQQRYLPDRAAVLRAVLSIGPRAADPRFEVWVEVEPLRLADGSAGGRRFAREQILDVSRPGEYERIRAELEPIHE